jgi:hypothetical protein
MRTIEEIRQDIKKSDDSVGIVRGYEYLNLWMELAQAQDERIEKLEAELAERTKDWEAVCAVMKGRNKCKKYAGLWKEADHADD